MQMSDIFSQLIEEGDSRWCRALEGRFIVRPKPGHEGPFQQIAFLAVAKAGERYGVLAETGPDGRYAALTLVELN
jgi:hypothetical protein